MTEDVRESRQQNDKSRPATLREVVEMLESRFSSVRIQTQVREDGTALNVEFLGNGANLEERRVLVSNLAHFLPPTLSIIGIKPEAEHKDAKTN